MAKPHLVQVWLSGCPVCLASSPFIPGIPRWSQIYVYGQASGVKPSHEKMKTHSALLLHFGNVLAVLSLHGLSSTELWAQDSPPAIATQPISKAVSLGANVTFSITSSGTHPFNFQWRMNQADLPLATNSILNLTNLQFSQAGDYQAVVSNASGSVTSLVAHLAVGPVFLKELSGAVATTSGASGGAWGDFNQRRPGRSIFCFC
jgi:hypothetical protein